MSYGFNLSSPSTPTKTASTGRYGFNLGGTNQSPTNSVVKTLSADVGGGAYNDVLGQPNTLVNTGHSTYANEPAVKGKQRDDIVPVGLGGVNTNPANIRLESSSKNGTVTDPIEKQAIKDYKAGKISLGEARLRVMTAKQQETGLSPTPSQQTTLGQLPGAMLEIGAKASDKFLQKTGDIFSAPFRAVMATEKGIGAVTEKAAQAITGKGNKTWAQAYKEAPTVGGMIAQTLEDIDTNRTDKNGKIIPVDKTKASSYFGAEFIGQLADAGVSTVVLAGVGSELATKNASIKITPAQISGEEPIPQSHVEVVQKIFKDAPEEVLNNVRKNGVEIRLNTPAGGLRQAVGEQVLGGRSEGTKMTVKIPNYEGIKGLSSATEATPLESVPGLPTKNISESTAPIENQPSGTPTYNFNLQKNAPSLPANETSPSPVVSQITKQPSRPEQSALPSPESAPKSAEPAQETSPLISQAKGTSLPDFIKSQNIEGLKTIDPALYTQAAKKLVDIHTEANKPVEQPLPNNHSNSTSSGIAKSIEAKAIEAKLTKGFSEVAGYDPLTFKEQAQKASDVVNSGVDNMRQIIRGEKSLPEGLRGTALIAGVEEYLKKNPNVDLQYDLANSHLVSSNSQAAQELGLSRMREQDSATVKLQEIKKSLEEAAKTKKVSKSNIHQQLKAATKVRLSKEELSWDKFLNEISC